MKNNKSYKVRVGGTLAASSAIAVVIGLYFKTQPASTEQHTQLVDSFGRLHTLNAKIAEETLTARHGLAPNYDPLTRSALHFSEGMRQLERELHALAASDPTLGSALGQLREQTAQRGSAIERFKTQNSVLKNSLYYLPLAADQVLDSLGMKRESSSQVTRAEERERSEKGAELAKAVSELVQVTLTQNLVGGRAETQRVEQQLQLAEGLRSKFPAEAQERYRLLVAHAKTASRTQQQVDPIVRNDVLSAPVGATLSQLEQRYSQQFESALREAAVYRTILYGWSILLLVAVLWAAFKLRSLYSGLESLVSERTHKLNQALKELWGEMDLAKKIQIALVPRKFSLRDCDVAAIMRPTAQVGGDYYDTFEVDGTEWVLIGDVSGHGVPAGLVMMMCQTSVRSVVAARPNIGPDELLTTVNRTLTQNIERLGEDKYMTISALRRDRDGSFRVAGMHQDFLIYRGATGRVEQLRAQGTWLGIAPNIRGLNPVRTLRLDPGDTLVLYTDGITEASRDGKMFDVDGLEEMMVAHGSESAERLLAGILAKLETYEVKDDVAAIVIKQLEPQSATTASAA